MAKQDNFAASALVRRAREVGMAAAGVDKMEKKTNELARQRMGRFLLVAIAVAMFVLAGRTGWRFVASRVVGSPRPARLVRDRDGAEVVGRLRPPVAQDGGEALRAGWPLRRVEVD